MTLNPAQASSLRVFEQNETASFQVPSKKINEGEDVLFWLKSRAYADIMTFILQLNAAMFPSKISRTDSHDSGVQIWELDTPVVKFSPTVERLQTLICKLDSIIEEAPPDKGPRRFGNISFRRWYEIVNSRLQALLDECLPSEVLYFGNPIDGDTSSKDELSAYLYDSFGSAQRLDYGTGHELSFLAFLAGIWKLHGFATGEPGVEERGIVLGVIEPYLRLIRRLILTYNLEPAGSHGVWGLDDHSFIPYILGSAQLSPAVASLADIPTEGSLPGAPNPADVAKSPIVERERKKNLYFGAVGFIYDVKKGPFWEHSSVLYDISGVKAGWAKINKGMLKMYNAEVLSKFPVVQHFPFGALFRWERDPNALPAESSIHMTSEPTRHPAVSVGTGNPSRPSMHESSRAPWALNPRSSTATPTSRFPIVPSAQRTSMEKTTRAPWAVNSSAAHSVLPVPRPGTPSAFSSGGSTTVPWARQEEIDSRTKTGSRRIP